MKYIIIYQVKEDYCDQFGYLNDHYNWYVAEDDNGRTIYFNDYDEAEQYKKRRNWYGQIVAI